MRAVGTGDENAEKRKRHAQIFSIGLLVILTVSSLGYAFLSNVNLGNSSGSSSSGTGSQVQDLGSGQWALQEGSQQILLTTSPDEAKNITFDVHPSLSLLAGQEIYISASQDIATELQGALSPYASKIQQACYGSCNLDLPEKDCNSTMIVWQNNADQKIYQKGKCYFIDGDKRAVDAFVYSLFNALR